MRGISKKILISLLTTLVVFITVFATTYAWVGIFTYANTDSFKMNLRVQDLDSNYFLTISSSGKPGTFSSEVPAIELKRQIVNNRYDNKYDNESDNSIETIFNTTKLKPLTTTIADNEIQKFYLPDLSNLAINFNLQESNLYYKFDLYLSVDTKEGINENTTGINTNVFLADLESILEGTITSDRLTNGNPFLDIPSTSEYGILNSLPNTEMFKIDSKNAMRFSLSLFEPININDEYDDNVKPQKSIIYQGGSYLPSKENDIYDLGGNLPLEYNTALKELLIIRPQYLTNSVENFYNAIASGVERGIADLDLTEANSQIVNKREMTKYLGCMNGVQTKMKITVYFWCEGWDADCIKGINEMPVTLNLSFTAGADD